MEKARTINRRIVLQRVVLLLTALAWVLPVSNRALTSGHCQSKTLPETESTGPPNPAFRYAIIYNYPLHNGRLVIALIDPVYFSEGNLRELFKLVSKRLPKPHELHVAVGTSLEQVPTPEEQDYAKSNPTYSPLYFTKVEKYPGGSYTRVKGNEYFQYSMGDGQPDKVVVIKGKEPPE